MREEAVSSGSVDGRMKGKRSEGKTTPPSTLRLHGLKGHFYNNTQVLNASELHKSHIKPFPLSACCPYQ